MKYAVISIVFIGVHSFGGMIPATAADETSEVIRIPECQILLAEERLLASGQSGIVSAVNVREGDRVRQGQLLAELDARVPRAALAVAAKQAENDVSVRFAKASARVAWAEFQAAREANRSERNTFSRIELEKLQLQQERSVLEIEVSQHEFEVNQLRRDEAAALVDSYRIVAPLDGLVTRVFKSPGEAVQVGETLLQCQSTDRVHVEAHVNIRLLRSVTPGRRVRVLPVSPNPAVGDAESGSEGTVFFVGVLADLTSQTVRVLVEVDNTNGLLVAGTDAVIELSPAPASDQTGEAQHE